MAELRLITPKKGRLKSAFSELLSCTGLAIEQTSERCDFGIISDTYRELPKAEILTQRCADAIANITDGIADAAIVGYDSFIEQQSAAQLAGLETPLTVAATFNDMASCRLSFIGPEKISTPEQLSGKRIVTSFPATVRRWAKENKIDGITVIARDGGVEDYVRLGLADAICDLVDTGRTLEANGLIEGLCILQSCAVLVKADDLSQTKEQQLDNYRQRLASVSEKRSRPAVA